MIGLIIPLLLVMVIPSATAAYYVPPADDEDGETSSSTFPFHLLNANAETQTPTLGELSDHPQKDLQDCFVYKSGTLLIMKMEFSWGGCYDIAQDLISIGWILAHVTTYYDSDEERLYFVTPPT